jgi:response regulator RpfG family c-di-GMP phosphodiesterase
MPMEVIVLTGYATVSTAIEAMKLGAYDYVTKPARMEELEVLVAKAAEKARLRRENAHLRRRLEGQSPADGIVTDDPAGRLLVEVELTLHNDGDAMRALSRPWENTAGVVYYTPPEMVREVAAQVTRIRAQLGRGLRERTYRVLPLPAVAGTTYEGGW